MAPYSFIEAMMTRAQWSESVAALRAAHGRRVIVPRVLLLPEQERWLLARGYRPYFVSSALVALARA